VGDVMSARGRENEQSMTHLWPCVFSQVVTIRLHFGSRAAYERYAAEQAAAEAAPAVVAPPPPSSSSSSGRHARRVHAVPHSSLLPWARRWDLLPPQRMFGHRASFHAG
jgi:hypothetical protein